MLFLLRISKFNILKLPVVVKGKFVECLENEFSYLSSLVINKLHKEGIKGIFHPIYVKIHKSKNLS